MNTGKQINAMVVVLFLTLISLGVYTIWDPFRSDAAEDEILEMTAERGAHTFALNCRVCHGDRGEGGSDAGRLAAAANLDRPELQGIEDGAFSQAAFDEAFDHVFNTITCGRVGTPMPVWGETQGGTLNEEQIRQLTVLITGGYWDMAKEEANDIDAEATSHAMLQMPGGELGEDETEITVSNAAPFTRGQYVRILIDEEQEERMRILPNMLIVDRGVDGTDAAEHAVGTEITFAGETGAAAETFATVAEEMDDEQDFVVVADLSEFSEGDLIQVEDETMRVTGTATGLPTTGQVLVRDVGREPSRLLISGAENVEAGVIIRIGAELMEVLETAVEDTGHNIAADITASDGRIAVSRPTFFARNYILQVEDELVRVLGPVAIDAPSDNEFGQVLVEEVGRAETRLAVSGSAGVEDGMTVRIGNELMRVTEVVRPAGVQIERGVGDTAASPHPAGTEFIALPAEEEGQEEGAEIPEEDLESTGRTLLEGINDSTDVAVVSSTTGLSVDQRYLLGDEIVRVRDSRAAILRVERGVEDSEKEDHGRRAPLFEGNLLAVERGYGGTDASAHRAGTDIGMTQVRVDRAVDDSLLEDHATGDELFLGASLIVERGARESEPAVHENGAFVMDFPLPPDGPPNVMQSCGQRAVEGGDQPADEEPIAGAPLVETVLTEWAVEPDPATVAAGPASFEAQNEGTIFHNLWVIQTDLPADQLPVAESRVDPAQVTVVAQSRAQIEAGDSAVVNVQQLAAGNYVLICNVPTHYDNGMRVAFQVTGP